MRRLVLPAFVAACTAPVEPPGPVAGTQVRFRVDADTSTPATFLDLPFPHDVRLRPGGLADWTGMPRPSEHAPTDQLLLAASDLVGWSPMPVVQLRFDAAVAAAHPDDGPRGRTPDDDVWLVELDASDPGASRLVPALAQTLERDDYVDDFTLAVTPYPGFALRGGVPHGVVVFRSHGDAAGAPLGVPAALTAIAAGLDPDGDRGPAIHALHAPLVAAVAALGRDPADVAAATVFTPADVVGETAAWTDTLRALTDVAITGLAPDPTDGLDHDRFCELHGTIRLPQLQQGTPPFDTEGRFVWHAGIPAVQREEDVPVVLTLPRGVMPAAGFPVVVYGHGSDGLSTQVVDRGRTEVVGGQPTVGEGPAHVLAARGFAAVGMATLLGPERLGREGSRAYLNLQNLAAYPDTWRQAQLETRLLLDALEALELPADAVAGCDGLDLGGSDAVRLDGSRLGLMGQSAGAHLVTEVGALDDRVAGIVPTGSGGYWPELLAGGSRVGGPPELFALILGTSNELTVLHPGLGLLAGAWAWAEPLVFARRLVHDPLPGHPRRHLLVPFGQDDGYFPEPIYDAMAVAYGASRAGEALWPEMDAALGVAGIPTPVDLPASGHADGVTAVAEQWAPDGLVDSHNVFSQEDGIKHQYGCFFLTLHQTGTPTVVVPGAEGDPCP